MMERLLALLKVKSLMTLIMTVVFAVLSLCGTISAHEFVTIYTVIVGFYFGTQHEKNGGKKE